MNYLTIPVGPYQANCYVISNETKECIIVDPGSEGNTIISEISDAGLKPVGVVLTHGHLDHISAIDDISKFYSIPIYIHQKEEEYLYDPLLNLSASMPHYGKLMFSFTDETLKIIKGEAPVTIGTITFTPLLVPGHTSGSICLYFKEGKFIVTGDTLFYRSIGRTDLTHGNHEQLVDNIKKKILKLPEDTKVLPGHGTFTYVKEEKTKNMFL